MSIAVSGFRLFLSVLLLRSAWHKCQKSNHFHSELAAYQLLPPALLSMATMTLIAAETMTALGLLNPGWSWPASSAASLFCVYALAMATNLLRGRSNIDCGCGGPLAAKKNLSWALVVRNVVLALLALLCATSMGAVALTAFGIFLIMASATVLLLLYEAIEQGLANSQRYQHWQTQELLKHR